VQRSDDLIHVRENARENADVSKAVVDYYYCSADLYSASFVTVPLNCVAFTIRRYVKNDYLSVVTGTF